MATTVEHTRDLAAAGSRDLDSLSARVIVSWTLAGGIVAGGFLLALATWGSPATASAVVPTAPILFAMGAAAGLVHGTLLAYLGRPDPARGRTPKETALLAAGGLLLGAPVALVTAGWISLLATTAALQRPFTRLMAWAAVGVGALFALWAVTEGLRALRNALARWPASRTGTVILTVILAVLVLVFHRLRPEIWFTDVRVTGAGAVALAFVATLWIAAPVVVLGLSLVGRRASDPNR